MATSEKAKAFQPGDHATTFGGGPVVCAAANAVIAEITERDLLANCLERSDQFRVGLESIDGVRSVRGRGLLLGAVLDTDRAAEVAKAALGHGLIVNAVRPDTVRFAPPLSITPDEVDTALDRFSTALG
jgi:acetylornithine aminotransferase